MIRALEECEKLMSASRFDDRETPGPRAESAYAALKIDLLEGGLGPGDKLSVLKLAAAFSCSRVPVMEALKRLQSEGFVEIVPQVGCRVVNPAAEDVSDYFYLFGAVEGAVAALAAERRTKADAKKFRELCAILDKEIALAGTHDERDPTYRHLNLRFHREIHRLAYSPSTSAIAAGMWDRSDFYIKMAFGSLFFSPRVLRSHATIRRAIIDGDANSAEQAVREHLVTVGHDAAQKIREAQASN